MLESSSDIKGLIRVRAAVGCFCLLLGSAAGAGWFFHIELLTQIHPSFAHMHPNTALCFVLTGIVFFAWIWQRKWLYTVTAVIPALLGILTLSEYVFRIKTGVQVWLLPSWAHLEDQRPVLMAVTTAFCFCLMSAAFLIAHRITAVHKHFLIGGIGAILFALGGASMIGYLSGGQGSLIWSFFTLAAVHTAVGLALIGIYFAYESWRLGSRIMPQFFVLVFGVTLAVQTYYILLGEEQKSFTMQFSSDAEDRITLFRRSVDADIQIMNALRAFHDGSNNVDRNEFLVFSKESIATNKSVKSLDWLPRVRAEERNGFEQAARDEGLEGYQFYERDSSGNPVTATAKDVYYPVYYTAPSEENHKRLGFDVSSDPVRLDDMHKIARSGVMGTVTPFLRADDNFKFIILNPIYQKNVSIETPDEREANLKGFVMGSFLLGTMLKETFVRVERPTMNMLIYDVTVPENEEFLYSYSAEAFLKGEPPFSQILPQEKVRFSYSETVVIGDRRLKFVCVPSADYTRAISPWMPWVAFWSVLVFVLLIAQYISLMTNRERVIRKTVRERTEELGKLNDLLQDEIRERRLIQEKLLETTALQKALLDGANVSIVSTDIEGVIRSVNPAAERMFGYRAGELIGLATPLMIHDPEEVKARAEALTKELGREILPGFETLVAKARLGKPDENEWTYTRKDGSRFPVLSSVTCLYDERMQIKGFLGIGIDLTDQKKSQEALLESENRFRTLVASAPVGIFQTDDMGRCFFANERYLEIAGSSYEEIMGDGWMAAVHPEDRGRVMKAWGEAIKSGTSLVMDGRVLRPDGGIRWVLGTAIPLLDKRGKTKGYLGTITDISDFRKAEEELRQSRSFLQNMINNLPLSVFAKSAKPETLGRFELWNATAEKWLGLKTEEVLGRTDYDFFPKDQADFFRAKDQEVFDSGKTLDIPFEKIQSRNLGERYLHTIKVPIYDEKNRPLYLLGISQDITEAKKTEMALRQSEERFREAFTHSAIGMALVSLDGHWQEVNRSLCAILGYSEEELLKLTFQQITHPEDLHADLENIKQLLAGKIRFYHMEKRYIHKKGHYVWGLLAVSLVRDELGQPLVFVAQVKDITERKNAVRQLQEKTLELARSNKELEEFAYVASHDLQEPLRKIISFSKLLEEKEQSRLDEESHDYLSRIVGGAMRMRQQIEDLLTYSRVLRKIKPFERIDLNAVISGVLSDLEIRIIETEARLKVKPLLPVMADPGQMDQLFLNLIGNALKFVRAGEAPCIEIEGTVLNNGFQEIRIKDNGIGFDEKYLDRIFVPFQRLHTRSEYEGTGIGLSICQKIVHRHGGEITAHSKPGQGAVFIFTLPLAR